MRRSSRVGSLGGLIGVALAVVHLGMPGDASAADPKFYLAENGVTVLCPDPDAVQGEVTLGNGTTVEFTKRDRAGVIANREEAARTCTSGITDMSSVFLNQPAFNGDISSWDTSSVTDMRDMFNRATAFNQDIGNWDTSSVTDMRDMFNRATAFNQDIGGWNTSSVTRTDFMFISATSFNQPIGGWDVSNVTDMSGFFRDAFVFNQDISGWNTSNVTDMRSMFFRVSQFNQDISGWDTSNVTNMRVMFSGASQFDQDISDWDTSNVADMVGMFSSASAFDRDIGGWTLNGSVNLSDMLDQSGMSVSCYDATLVGWAGLDPAVTGRSLGADGLVRSAPSDAARAVLVDDRDWTISGDADGGTVAGACAEPVAAPAPVSGPSLACVPAVLSPGRSVTCTVSGADAGIEILWRAAFNPVFAEAGVSIGADGTGTFAFIVPAAALGSPVTVELVDWSAPTVVGTASGPVPSSVPSGEGPVALWRLVVVMVLAGGLIVQLLSWPRCRFSA